MGPAVQGSHLTPPVGGIELGAMPSAGVIQSLGLPAISTSAPGTQPAGGLAINPFAAILPLLTSAVDQRKG